MMYSPSNYGMGEVAVPGAATAPVSATQAQAAQRELARMRGSLTSWLATRAKNDAVASGSTAVEPALLRRPGSSAPPRAVFAQRLAKVRASYERNLAADLYALLSEVLDPAQLPNPDLARNPNAAVQLAQIAIAGRLPGEAPAPHAQGLIWLWPLVIVVGAVSFVLTSKIRSDAEVARERERYECIKAGACTDTGFWLKVGAVGVVGWLAWSRFGVRDMIRGSRRRR